jgi:hypothetical protein
MMQESQQEKHPHRVHSDDVLLRCTDDPVVKCLADQDRADCHWDVGSLINHSWCVAGTHTNGGVTRFVSCLDHARPTCRSIAAIAQTDCCGKRANTLASSSLLGNESCYYCTTMITEAAEGEGGGGYKEVTGQGAQHATNAPNTSI